MNCFYHHERSAVGICKNCQRGLCPECAAEVPDGLACVEKCEGKVLLLGRLIEGNQKAYRKSGTGYIIAGTAMGVMAASMNVIVLRLEAIQALAPGFNYVTVPIWIGAVACVLIGVWIWRTTP
jgi:hypothetical protein